MKSDPLGRPCVAHVLNSYYRLSENWIVTQIQNTHRYAPIILSQRTDQLPVDPPPMYPVLERPWPERLVNQAFWKVAGYYPGHYVRARQYGARIIHAHFGPAAWHSGLGLAARLGVPLVTTFYGFDASRVPATEPEWVDRYHRLFRDGDLFLVEGPSLAEKLKGLGCPSEKVRIQHLGVELERFPVVPRDRGAADVLKVLIVGRMTEKKGMPDALRAVAGAVASGVDISVSVIGDASPDERSRREKERVLTVIARHQLEDRVTLLGIQPHDALRRAYYDHHVLLAPSVTAATGDSEGGAPVTIVEASATGMPVIATHHADIPEVVEDGVTGLLAPEHDIDTLADHLFALAADPEGARTMGLAGAARIREGWDAARQGERLAGLYDEIL